MSKRKSIQRRLEHEITNWRSRSLGNCLHDFLLRFLSFVSNVSLFDANLLLQTHDSYTHNSLIFHHSISKRSIKDCLYSMHTLSLQFTWCQQIWSLLEDQLLFVHSNYFSLFVEYGRTLISQLHLSAHWFSRWIIIMWIHFSCESLTLRVDFLVTIISSMSCEFAVDNDYSRVSVLL